MTNAERIVREQQAFEKWILENAPSLGYRFLNGWRDEHGIVDYQDVDARNKWSGWLAARTGWKSWEDNT